MIKILLEEVKLYVAFKRASHKNKINKLYYPDSLEVWINKRGFHFGFIPSIILNIIGKDKISVLGIQRK